MLKAVIAFSLRRRGVIIALACAFLGFGVYSFSRVSYDVFPEFAPPRVAIQTEAPGLSPEEVEALVTRPIENAVNGAAGIESLRSKSVQGLSVITVVFESGRDIYQARQTVAERLTAVSGRLPQGVEAPALTPLTSSTGVVGAVGLTWDTRAGDSASGDRHLMDLRSAADWIVKPRILSVSGIAQVSVFGGEVKQIQIRVKSERLIQYGLTIDDVMSVAQRVTGLRGAGFIDHDRQRIVLKTQGQALTAGEIAQSAFVAGSGANVSLSVTLGDVADVVEGPEPPVGAAAVGGEPGVMLIVSSQYGANTLDVTKRMDQALADLRPELEAKGIALHTDIFRPADFIETAVSNIRSSLMIGAVLVVLVLFVFLADVRTAAISCAAIPLSLLAAVAVLERFGYSFNTMTIGGLAISVGLVVDDAIITVENIMRRARENRRLPNPRHIMDVTIDAALEVRSAVVYATLAVGLVFVPVLTMPGIAGRLFAPLGLAYLLATFASLVVALTVTPALCFAILRVPDAEDREPPLVRSLKEKYRALLLRLEPRRGLLIAGVALLTLAALASFPFFGGEFLPELRENALIVHMAAPLGTSLDESLRLGRRVHDELMKLPFVRSVAQQAGRAEAADDVWGTHYSEFVAAIHPRDEEESERAVTEIRRALAAIPEAAFAVETFLTERVEETLTGHLAAVVVNLFGTDLDALDAKAQDVARVLKDIPGADGVRIQFLPGVPQMAIHLRPADLTRWGLNALDVLDAVHAAYQGAVVGQVHHGMQVFDVVVILDPGERNNLAGVGALPLRAPAGTFVRLGQVADISRTTGREAVLHEGMRSVQAVTCNVSGRDVRSFVAEAKKRVQSSVDFPQGMYPEFSGAAAAQERSVQDILVRAILAAAGIVILLSLVIHNLRNLFLVLMNLPFALVGGVLAVFVTTREMSVGTLVGFVTLFGISLRNSIMMMSHFEHLVFTEGSPWNSEICRRGASDRLAPILMTSLVTALGLLPMAIGGEAPGQEIEGPMAMVILGGLITSTLLNLLVLPALALRYGRFEKHSGDL